MFLPLKLFDVSGLAIVNMVTVGTFPSNSINSYCCPYGLGDVPVNVPVVSGKSLNPPPTDPVKNTVATYEPLTVVVAVFNPAEVPKSPNLILLAIS